MNKYSLIDRKKIFLFAILLGVATDIFSQVPTPVAQQNKPILLAGGTAHIGDGQVIENSFVGFENGKITIVSATRPADTQKYEIVDAQGKHIYPGLILPSTITGLEDIGALRQTRDHTEVGDINPNVRALPAYNTDSEIQPTLRFNGIQLVQTTPAGDLIAGKSSIVQLDAWNWEDAAYKADDGIHLYWPGRYKEKEGKIEEDTAYNRYVQTIARFFADSKTYMEMSDAGNINLKLASGKGLFTGDVQLFIHVNQAKEIINSISLAQEHNVRKIVLITDTDAWYVKDFLKEKNIPVLIKSTHELPQRDFEDVYLPYKLPKLLWDEGILVGLTAHHEMLSNAQNLAFVAGTASAFGLTKEKALQLITLNNAKILGIDDRAGTLTVGKDANIVVSEGDLLDMKENEVFKSYILGKEIDLEGKQQMLYERFRQKYKDSGHIEE